MTREHLKEKISKNLNLPKEVIKCGNCTLWGGNNQRVINSYSESTCLNKKISGKVASYRFCKHFCPLNDIIWKEVIHKTHNK